MDKEEDRKKLNHILVKGARVHNLKNIDVSIPHNQLTVISGLSGSGKSSLAFDTIYAEGQRRYVESLSSYARQFLGRMDKPDTDYIKGISPAVAIEQRVTTRNPRSTVGTSTEIYDYIKLLFARTGHTYSPLTGNRVKQHSVSDVVDFITQCGEEHTCLICFPIQIPKGRSVEQQLQIYVTNGYSRIRKGDQIFRISDMLKNPPDKMSAFYSVVVDRVNGGSQNEDNYSRIADSVQTSFFEGSGRCLIEVLKGEEFIKNETFSNRFEEEGIQFEEPSVDLFSYNNPYGACKHCEGFGSVIGVDEDLVIPNKNLSIFEEAVACWKGEKMSEWKEELVMNAYKFEFPIHKPYYDLSDAQVEVLWKGNQYFQGIFAFFKWVEEQSYKIQYRVMLARYRGKTLCPECQGTRLRKDANYVKVGGVSVSEMMLMPISKLIVFFKELKLDKYEEKIANRLLIEINNRLQYLDEVGLGYLTLNRSSSTLSGGESQRMSLSTALGSSLVGSTYILDEPSVGLHPRDTHRLITILKHLRDAGNTVIVVEHDEEIIRAADYLVDMGPLAGYKGGEVVFQGKTADIMQCKDSLTGKFLRNENAIPLPKVRKKWKEFIEIKCATENNLKRVDVKIPLGILTVVTGVSGSGKSSLVRNILYPAMKKHFGNGGERPGKHHQLVGDMKSLAAVEFVDQNPIGRSSRSNPVTYIKAFDDIRSLFASQPLAKTRAYTPGYFSFNVPGGRCEECEGEGEVKIEMQFMADLKLLCESCHGKRYKDEVLEVTYRGKNISEVLEMTITEAIELFSGKGDKLNSSEKSVVEKLTILDEIGMGYMRLGQSSSTLSGGEAQRVKLGFFLSHNNPALKTLFIFDEPTTGLHAFDIEKLLKALHALISQGHSVLVIEHNPEVIKCADWVVDLGPEGGDAGGYVLFEGVPEDLVKQKGSQTGRFLKNKI
ncbi:MAG: excinuclease ABC subunit UvrA [Bacteroidota bacterium]